MAALLDHHRNAPSALAGLSGTVLERRYALGGILGAGGMGAVFEARDLRLERAIAIKVLRPVFVGHDEYIKRFLREAQAASKIRHRNVVVILDYGEAVGGLVYSVMELLVGRDVEQLLRSQPEQRLPWPQAYDMLMQIAGGLRAAHRQGVIHRDIKPANCFVTIEDDEPVVKVVDFGIAKVEDAGTAQLTSTGNLLGTPSYIAPELIRTQCPAAPRSDVYSLGVLAFRMLTGRLPFTGETAFEVMRRACMEPPPSLLEAVPELPTAVAELVLEMLAKAPEERPADMGVVRERLRMIGGATLGARVVEIPASSPLTMEGGGVDAANAEDRTTLPRGGTAHVKRPGGEFTARQLEALPGAVPKLSQPAGAPAPVLPASAGVPRTVHDPTSAPSRSGETVPAIGEATLRLMVSRVIERPSRTRWVWAAVTVASLLMGIGTLAWFVMDGAGGPTAASIEAGMVAVAEQTEIDEAPAAAAQVEGDTSKLVSPPGAEVAELEDGLNDAKAVMTPAVPVPTKPASKGGRPKPPAGPPSDAELKKRLARKIKERCATELAREGVTVVFDVTTSGGIKRLAAIPKGAVEACAKRQVVGTKFRPRVSETNIEIEVK